MSDKDHNGAFERRTKRLFDDSVAALDAATRSRLTQARHRALEERPVVRGRRASWWLLPAGSIAAAALVWLTLWQAPPPSETVPAQTGSVFNPKERLQAGRDGRPARPRLLASGVSTPNHA